jgi:hypothetical protein
MNIHAYPGDQKAKDTLRRYDSKVSLEELKSAVMGSILAVEMVPPSRVLEILHGEDGERPEFESIKHAQEHMEILMALWNKLAEHQSLRNPFHFSEIPSLDAGDSEGWMSFCRLRELEITSFLRGLYAGGTPSAAELYEPTEEDLRTYLPLILEIGRKTLARQREAFEQGQNDLPPGMIGALAEHLNESYLSLYDDFLKQVLLWRKEHMTEIRNEDTVVRQEPKVGRNESCPCGSGKKFKHCCLQ